MWSKRTLSLALYLLALGTAARVSATGLCAGANVNISRLASNQAEPTIAIDPQNPALLFAGGHLAGGGPLFAAFSGNGGATWNPIAGTGMLATGMDGLPAGCCDSSAAADGFGNIYLAYLAQTRKSVVVLLSTDGGMTFRLLA